MPTTHVLESRELVVEGRPATVHVGGEGEALLLVHGGLGGAAFHWAPVWEALAQRFRVIAPELPGIGRLDQPGPGSVQAYARWLEGVLEALGEKSAWCVGNSFGGMLTWQLAVQAPARCRGLVLVNGRPLGPTPGWVQTVGRFPPTRRLLLGLYRRIIFGPRALAQCFVAPERLPVEVRTAIHQAPLRQMESLFDAIAHGAEEAVPTASTLLLFGEEDRLALTRARDARALHAKYPGSQLAFLPRAGHLPQVEAPEAFIAALLPFLASPPLPRGEGRGAGSVSRGNTPEHPVREETS